MYNKINAKVYILEKNIPVATTLIYINQCNTDKQSLEEKIGDVDKKRPNVSGLVTTNFLNTKISKVENEIPNVSGVVQKSDYDAKITDIKGENFTTSDYDTFTGDILNAKIKQKELGNKSVISNLIKYSDLSTKLGT